MSNKFKYYLLIAVVLMSSGCGDGNGNGDIDKVPPIIETFIINDGDSITDTSLVNITIIASDNEGLAGMQMRYSNNEDFSGADWVSYANSISHDLTSNNGLKIVFGQVQDATGNASAIKSDSIVLRIEDTTPPEITTFYINNNLSTTDQLLVTLTIGANDDSGLSELEMRISEDSTFADVDWEDFSSTVDYQLSDGDGEKEVFCQVRDGSGNLSTIVYDIIVLELPDTTPPVITSFEINSGESITNVRSVTLTISADDNKGTSGLEMRISEDFDFIGSDWIILEPTHAFDLSDGDGLKTVYIQVRDASLNISNRASDSITLLTAITSVYFVPDTLVVSTGGSYKVQLAILNATNMISGKFVIKFDPDFIEVMGCTVDLSAEHILAMSGADIIVTDNDYDNEIGYVSIGAIAREDGFTGVTGDGLFAEIELRVKSAFSGIIILEIFQEEIYDYPVSIPPVPVSDVIRIDGFLEYSSGQ